ncbi:phosphatidylinositol 4-kinase gamma 4-like [Bidens hawaiensis]|uniref:phosphatidylinositol 4-kinase gamma 4-like n=1 Tax=Bidens hawaiensis TaxID=980011 RepID=UPI0040491DB0
MSAVVDVGLGPIHMGFAHNVHKPIVIYLTVSGSVIPMCILESDSVASVELKVQTCKGFLVKKQKIQNLGYLLQPVIVNPYLKIPNVIWSMLNSASRGLKFGKKPVRSTEGTGGAYFMRHAVGNETVAVFKPVDEEPMAVNNPNGLPVSETGEGLKRGTKVGGALREVAAYILDHPLTGPRSTNREMGFAGVPPTVMVKCLSPEFNHPLGYVGGPENVKVGSLQMFVKNCGSCEDMGPRDFPVEEVHKITVLDIRTANADRHAGNILMNREEGRIVLTPIDHGYCLPENFKDCTFDWLYWPQACEPYSKQVIDYINSLDAEEDIALLRSHGWDLSRECAHTFRISTMLLKKGASKGLSPFAIGQIMCRVKVNEESMIEKMVKKAHESMLKGMNKGSFLETVSEIMDYELENMRV